MRKQKNKAISGRRNRCHALPPLPLIFKVNKEISQEHTYALSESIYREMNRNNGRFLVITDPKDSLEIINPNLRKRPRVLS